MAIPEHQLHPEYTNEDLQKKIEKGFRQPHPFELSADPAPKHLVDINPLPTEDFDASSIQPASQEQYYLYK